MKFSTSFKNTLINIICYAFILLFVYASVSKLLDYGNFRIQLGQSPLISAYSGSLVWFVPVLEICTAVALLFRKLRFWGLYASFILMLMFTVYIFIMLKYSSYLPCSCGGILEKLGWIEHLIFNILFVIIALVGMIFLRGNMSNKYLINH